ncbi:MAG: Prokaryotic lipoprotein-attachment site [Burkholderiales bacterium]|jgi:predicted small lipoprotein YifL|nr:Prokaryotic lipoprotein-attachment site [Burkholderiales bacterium]HJQ63194.1 lipoprotein [Burkholderiales bacterium]
MRTALSLLVIVPLIAACGYKGPLYLPKPKPEAQVTPAPPAEDTKKAKEGP